MGHRGRTFTRLMGGAAAMALLAGASMARAEDLALNIAPQPLGDALNEFAVQAKQGVVFSPGLVAQKRSHGVSTAPTAELALAQLLDGTGLSYRNNGDTFLIVRADDPQSGSAAGGGAEVEALIVTAQKREEDIQDVPIAMSAFTQEQLERSQVAGGPDLMTQVPNMTFTKTNFSSYSIQIRGIGTQAISATTDAAVAVAFNNTPFIRNRFFEQEFYDLQRVEVLRGPQGTLYGRNATAGVVNLISQKPKFAYEAKLSADVSNYNSTRLEGMVNVPLVEDRVALRLAGAWTKREGYSTNQITGNPIDGRDLWSTRLSLRFAPSDRLDANLIWEHFQESDDRLRSGKQLCHTDEVTGITVVRPDGTQKVYPTGHLQTLDDAGFSSLPGGVQATFSQGCIPESLYSPDSFQTPNGLSLPYYLPTSGIGLPINDQRPDPYVSRFQSQDLRVIESTVDPDYRAKTDLVELQLSFDISDSLTLTSETGYLTDFIYSSQDYNRFNTAPGAWEATDLRPGVLLPGENGGIFCDPQIGCADRLVAVDLSTARSRHFSQELRLASDFDGPFNFSLGANFLRYDTEDKYYVFINSLSLLAASHFGSQMETPYTPNVSDNYECMVRGLEEPDFTRLYEVQGCIYMDPNPIDSVNDLGHNYFLSRNPYKLISYAVFGEAYYNVTDNLKITGGLRWTVDKKEAPMIPSWILASDTAGYPVQSVQEQEWREPTGRLTVDWKPNLGFTDETLLYGSYAHGYKAGGSNPPPPGLAVYAVGEGTDYGASLVERSAAHPRTFEAEYVDAFEIGAKNTLLDGRLTANAAAFYYDYKGYQISQIIDRSAVNFNFDAEVWGLEIEADWRPLKNLRLGLKGGYEQTRVADGMRAIDVMDRTAGDPNWVVSRPFPTFPSNCILPSWLFEGYGGTALVALGGKSGGNPTGCELAYVLGFDPVTAAPYMDLTQNAPDPFAQWNTLFSHPDYPGWDPATAPNNGEGIFKDLSGNELPNAPHFTATISADYTLPLPNEWLATLHTDLYYQSEAWTRIFNTEGYDKLKAYTNVNVAAIFTNEEAGWKVMAYIKNVFDRDSITGSFLNSDDTGLTTNVFLTEPRLYGLRVTKEWNGGPWWTGAGTTNAGPFPLTVEIGGQAQRYTGGYATLDPFSELYSARLNTAPLIQHRDLDVGDGRSLRLTWRPRTGTWSVSAGLRYGKANTDTTRVNTQEDGPTACAFELAYQWICDLIPAANVTVTNFSDASSRDSEEHEIVDFAVGREFGVGSLARSEISVGMRGATLQSDTYLTQRGLPLWDLPEEEGLRGAESSQYRTDGHLAVAREFKGAGPTVSWEAAETLLGTEETGRLNVEWTVTGGLLFGKQKTTFSGTERTLFYEGIYAYQPFDLVTGVTAPVGGPDRSHSLVVPALDLSLGLTYEVQRIKIGAGYRWERYFDALDVGFEEAEDADRTIDGPYFKIAVGFGG